MWVSILYRKINLNSNSNTPTLPYPTLPIPKIPSQKKSANRISADKLQINLSQCIILRGLECIWSKKIFSLVSELQRRYFLQFIIWTLFELYHDKNLSKKRANFNDINWTRNWHTWTMTYKILSDFVSFI